MNVHVKVAVNIFLTWQVTNGNETYHLILFLSTGNESEMKLVKEFIWNVPGPRLEIKQIYCHTWRIK